MNTQSTSKSLRTKSVCAVCGYRHLLAPQRIATGGASHEICPACGFESGFTDDVEGHTYEQWRAAWVSKGLPWTSKGMAKPAEWNPMIDVHALLRRKRPVISSRILAAAARINAGAPPSQAPRLAHQEEQS